MKMRKQFFSESGKKPSHSKPNGFTSKFFEAFWSELKNPLLLFCKSCFLSGELNISQKQAPIKLL